MINHRGFASFSALIVEVRALLDEPNFPTPLTLMLALGGFPEAPTVSQVAKRACVTLKNASRVLKTLRAKGWIRFHAHGEDERMKLIELTAKGGRLLAQIEALLARCVAEFSATPETAAAKR